MIRNRSMKPLMLAGLAAAAYYAYSKMSPEKRESMVGSIKKHGKDILGNLWPAGAGALKGNNTDNQM